MADVDLLIKLFDTLRESNKESNQLAHALLTNQNDISSYIKWYNNIVLNLVFFFIFLLFSRNDVIFLTKFGEFILIFGISDR